MAQILCLDLLGAVRLADDPALRLRLAEAALRLSQNFAGWDQSVAALVKTLCALTRQEYSPADIPRSLNGAFSATLPWYD